MLKKYLAAFVMTGSLIMALPLSAQADPAVCPCWDGGLRNALGD